VASCPDSLEFISWLTETTILFKNFSDLSCISIDGSVIALHVSQLDEVLTPLWFQCHGQTIFTIVLGIFACVLLIVGLTGTLYKRWRLRYLYYIGRRRVNPYNSLGTPVPVGRRLDVFVSYDEDDRRWRRFVQEVLVGKMEEHHISCLISEIHFLCRRNAREIMVEAVLGTRRTLALLTNDFFKSRDRELEFNMAVLHGMETRQDIVIPVAMETLDLQNLPAEVQEFLKAYIRISSTERVTRRFGQNS